MSEMYNTKNAGVRRLMQEAKELRKPTEMYHAQPLEDNLFEWHFTIRGTIGSDFEGGIYHGRIIFPPDYPMKPPNLILLTPNGRFELNKKICLSISGYHPETWLPSWSIRTALLALIGFLPSPPAGSLGSLDYPPKERKRLAKLCADWKCKECGAVMKDVLLPITEDGQLKETEEAKQLAAQLKFQDESVVKEQVAEANNQLKTIESLTESSENNEQRSATESEVISAGSATVNGLTESAPLAAAIDGQVLVEQNAPEEPIQERISDVVNQLPARGLASRNFDWSLFVTVPLALICIAIFITLLARRILVDSPISPNDKTAL